MTTETTLPEVGQTIYVSTLVGRSHEMKPLLVTRVGRKWFYAAPEGASRERQFDLDTWAENSNFGAKAVALTVEEYAERKARAAAVARLYATGHRITSTTSATPERYLTPEQLHAIAEIIEKGEAE